MCFNECVLLLQSDSYWWIKKTCFNNIILEYPIFNTLNEHDKISFLFDNIDPFICKKIGYFVFQSFNKRKQESGCCN